MALKYLYYVVVATEDGAKFVTKVDNATKTAYWDSKEKPLPFNKTYADDKVAFSEYFKKLTEEIRKDTLEKLGEQYCEIDDETTKHS